MMGFPFCLASRHAPTRISTREWRPKAAPQCVAAAATQSHILDYCRPNVLLFSGANLFCCRCAMCLCYAMRCVSDAQTQHVSVTLRCCVSFVQEQCVTDGETQCFSAAVKPRTRATELNVVPSAETQCASASGV